MTEVIKDFNGGTQLIEVECEDCGQLQKFCECSEINLSKVFRRNATIEMPALELFWGNPNGQFFKNGWRSHWIIEFIRCATFHIFLQQRIRV